MSEEKLWNLILKLIGGLIVGFQIFLVIFMLLFSKEPAPADLSVIPMDYETWGEYLRNPVPFNETLFQTTCFIVLFSQVLCLFSFLYLLSERGRRYFLPLLYVHGISGAGDYHAVTGIFFERGGKRRKTSP